MVTYAVVDAQTGSMLSSHETFDAARAQLASGYQPDTRSIYVFDDTGHVAGECSCAGAESACQDAA